MPNSLHIHGDDVIISPPENCSKKLRKFRGKIALNFDVNCAKMVIFIYYINNAECMLEALLV